MAAEALLLPPEFTVAITNKILVLRPQPRLTCVFHSHRDDSIDNIYKLLTGTSESRITSVLTQARGCRRHHGGNTVGRCRGKRRIEF
jgi:hypothetical protein